VSDDNTAKDVTEIEPTEAPTDLIASMPMKGLRKAAIAVMALGAELAGRIFTLLSPEEVESLLVHAESLVDVTADEVLDVLRELNDQVDHQVAGVSGHEHMIRDAALAALGSDKLSSILGGESLDAAGQVAAAAKSDPEGFARTIALEHPQVVTVVLTLLNAEIGGMVLRLLPDEMRAIVIERLATIKTVPQAVIAQVADIVGRDLKRSEDALPLDIEGMTIAVGLLKNVGTDVESQVFEELKKRDQDLADEIRSLMFVFEDIVILHPREVQLILREVDSQQLAIALKGVKSELKEFILGNMSSRAAMIVLDELEALGPLAPDQVKQAQDDIIAIVSRLAEDGKVNLRPGDTM
jgi:flagellar motor switch protein FliG